MGELKAISVTDYYPTETEFSADRRYRYVLVRFYPRLFGPEKPVIFVMLNPSTADETKDDPTMKRVGYFCEKFGFTRAIVVNLYSFRSSNPNDLIGVENPVGLGDSIITSIGEAPAIVAWGSHRCVNLVPGRVEEMLKLLNGRELFCLGVNADGSPKHPLYLGNDTELQKWEPSNG